MIAPARALTIQTGVGVQRRAQMPMTVRDASRADPGVGFLISVWRGRG